MHLQAGINYVIWAYHSKGPDSMTTLDSLPPEGLGSTSFKLLRGTNADGTEKSDAYFAERVSFHKNYSCKLYSLLVNICAWITFQNCR